MWISNSVCPLNHQHERLKNSRTGYKDRRRNHAALEAVQDNNKKRPIEHEGTIALTLILCNQRHIIKESELGAVTIKECQWVLFSSDPDAEYSRVSRHLADGGHVLDPSKSSGVRAIRRPDTETQQLNIELK